MIIMDLLSFAYFSKSIIILKSFKLLYSYENEIRSTFDIQKVRIENF